MKRLLLLFSLIIPALTPAMEVPLNPTIVATPTTQVLSLKQQAARAACRAIHPDSKKVSLDQAKVAATKAKTITNPDVKAYLLAGLKVENADAFEAMLTEEPQMLTKRRLFAETQLTQDTKKVLFLERHDWQFHTNQLFCLDIPTGKETIIDLNKTPYHLLSLPEDEPNYFYIPNHDGSQLALACTKNLNYSNYDGRVFLVIYDAATQKFNEIIQLPTSNIQLRALSNNIVVANRTTQDPEEVRTYLIDCAQKRITTVPQPLLSVSKSGRYFTTKTTDQNVTLHTSDGSAIGVFNHTRSKPALNEAETQITTIVNNGIHIYDINTRQLLHRIEYPFLVDRVLFKNDHTVIARSNITHDGTYAYYETDLKTEHTKELVKSRYSTYVNRDGSLSLTGGRGPITLATTENKNHIKTFNNADESWAYEGGFANNDEHILIQESSMYLSFQNIWIKRYPTFKRITNNIPLEQLIDLCVETREKKEQSWMSYLRELVLNASA